MAGDANKLDKIQRRLCGGLALQSGQPVEALCAVQWIAGIRLG
jgi:hypothetical protein